MIQISQITFKNITLKDIIFSDGEDLMKLFKKLGKENIDIQDDELQTPHFEEKKEEEKNHDRSH